MRETEGPLNTGSFNPRPGSFDSDSGGIFENDFAGIREKQKERSLKIINSILTRGILSTSDQIANGDRPFTSYDIDPGYYICTRVVLPPDESFEEQNIQKSSNPFGFGRTTVKVNGMHGRIGVPNEEKDHLADFMLRDALYGNRNFKRGWSIMHVLAERKDEPGGLIDIGDLTVKLTELRLAQSMLVVMPISKFQKRTRLSLWESRLRSPVSPDKFEAVLLPERVIQEVGTGIKETTVPILSVGNVKRQLFKDHQPCEVPDYESTVRNILEQTAEPVLLHGVRLPTHSDIRRICK